MTKNRTGISTIFFGAGTFGWVPGQATHAPCLVEENARGAGPGYCGVTVRLRVTVWVMTSPVVELAVT